MKNILIVDDNKLNLATAKKVLGDLYKVIPVMKGSQALTYLENNECDILLLDINMPEMDGFEVLSKIRLIAGCESLPVIFLTADNDAETETRCFREGAVDFIAKPFVPEVMLSRIARVLEIEALRRSLADRLEQKTQEVSVMKSKSRQDALTGLWNRAHTEETVNAMIEEGVSGALMMIDMDNFKAINDNYGHIAGDKVLKMFAETMRRYAAEGDVLCRIGGDEFVVFVKGVTAKQQLAARAADMIADLTAKIEELKYDTNTSVSIGIAQTPDDGRDFNKIYNAADKALYCVKQNGKSSYHFFSDKVQSEGTRSGRTVDLGYLHDLMNRSDNGRGAYLLDFDSFNQVYNFIRRFIERSKRDVSTLLFTLSDIGGEQSDVGEMENAMELLEKAVYISLRRSDVSTRYSSRQLVVILMDAGVESCDMVAERIVTCFSSLYKGEDIRIDYGVARMDGEALSDKKAFRGER